ncbi:hypothetical protein WOLCODRAFT_76048, partial [Wolfiporia cocos MD-104 SS10]
FGCVDIVFNNARVTLSSEIEGTPDDAARALSEVNFRNVSVGYPCLIILPRQSKVRFRYL